VVTDGDSSKNAESLCISGTEMPHHAVLLRIGEAAGMMAPNRIERRMVEVFFERRTAEVLFGPSFRQRAAP
jgi:hypothetical protein